MFVSFINSYLTMKLWDYDFWWHISTGRYIAESKVLPDEDPFSFVNNLEENEYIHPTRAGFILKQYWLSQILFYKVYSAFDEKGMILLRSALLFATVFLVFVWLQRHNVKFYIAFPAVFFAFQSTMVYTGERPVLFTILFTVIAFFILEEFKRKESRALFALIPLMFLWANLHGGFIMGNILILTWIIGETINLLLKRGSVNKNALITLCISGFAAVGVSGLNPNGFTAFLSVLPSLSSQKSTIFHSNIQEYASLYSLYSSKVRGIDWEYIILALLFPALALLRRRKMDIVYYILLTGLLYASFNALRFMIYYVCIAAMILGREMHYFMQDYLGKHKRNEFRFEAAVASLVLISSVVYAGAFIDAKKITFERAERYSIPEGAVDFIESSQVKGNMFNDMGFGGYFIWRLYPWKKVFTDTRELNATVLAEYDWIIRSVVSLENKELPEGKKPLWERLIDHYNIDIIVLDTMDIYGLTAPVITSLLKSDKWVPVYSDLISVVFLRDINENEEIISSYRLPDDAVYNSMIIRLTQWSQINENNPRYLISLGDVMYNMGRLDDALKAYEYAERRLPGIKIIERKKEAVKELLEQKKSNNGIETEEL
jgi:hypothetical protein